MPKNYNFQICLMLFVQVRKSKPSKFTERTQISREPPLIDSASSTTEILFIVSSKHSSIRKSTRVAEALAGALLASFSVRVKPPITAPNGESAKISVVHS